VIVCGSLELSHSAWNFVCAVVDFSKMLPLVTHCFVTHMLCETCTRLTQTCDDALVIYLIYYNVFGNDRCD
jgi:hypothetical protein